MFTWQTKMEKTGCSMPLLNLARTNYWDGHV
jgi:hypothetical protein